MAVSLRSSPADHRLLIYLCLLIVFGLVALISASTPVGYAKFHDTYFFVKRQLLFGLLPGLILFLITTKISYRLWQRFAWLVYGATLFLLVLVFVPGAGTVINGSRSWLSIDGFNVQPAEFAKFGVIIMAAALLAARRASWDRWQESLLPILAILAPSFLLVVAQPDVGTLSIMAVIIFMMLFIGGVPARFLAVLGGLAVVAFAILVMIAPYRATRLTTFLRPELDPRGVGYHINQAFLAVGSGGFWGLGFGNSRQKFEYLPEVSADSIYAVIAEEGGFMVGAGLVILFVLLGWRGFKLAQAASDPFARLVTSGMVVWILWQAFLNIGAMVGVLPLTGVPLPFISHGGSAIVAMLIGFGVVTNVSKEATIKPA